MNTFSFKHIYNLILCNLFICIILGFSNEAKANGTTYYFDVNGTTAGFGAPSGSYSVSGSYWSTTSSGTGTPVALPNDAQLTFGNLSSDFSGNTFTINFDVGRSWQGLEVTANNANITISGSNNAYLNATQTWTIASGSILNMSLSYNGVGLNMNGSALTLAGGGTLNWTTAVGYNCNGSTVINQNGSGLVVNLSAAAGDASQASYTLTQGTLNFASASAANAFYKMLTGESAKFTIAGGTINNTSGSAITLNLNTGSYVLAGSFTFTGTNDINFGTHAVALTGASTITASANTLTLGGVLSGAFALGKSGAGTLTLSGTNTYSGATTINAGTLKAGSTSAFGSNSAFTLANVASAILDITGFSNTIGSITGGGTTGGSVTLGATTLTIGSDNTSPSAYAGVISGTGAITKSGSGTLILSGSNTYSGLTTINAGTLKLGATGGATNTPLGTTGAGTTVASDAFLDVAGFTLGTAEALTINGANNSGTLINSGSAATYSGNITIVSGTYTIISGPLTLTGTITRTTGNLRFIGTIIVNGSIQIGAGQLQLYSGSSTTVNTASTHTGGTLINNSTLILGHTGALSTSGTVTLNTTTSTLDLNGITPSTALNFNVKGTGVSGVGAIINSSSTSATYPGLITLTDDASIMTTSGNITISNVGSITGAYDLTLGGSYTGSLVSILATSTGGVTKTGSGTWILSGVNSYDGLTTISAGTLRASNASALGSTSGATTITGTAAPYTWLDISGVTITGETVTLNTGSDRSYISSTGTSVWNGTITIAGTGIGAISPSSGTLTVQGTIGGSASSLHVRGNGDGIMDATISIGGTTLAKTDAGTWTINSTGNTWGATTIASGPIKLGAAGVIPDASAVTVSSTLDMNTFSETVGSIAGAGTIDNVSGAGTPTLTCGGNNSTTTFSGILQNTTGTLALIKTGSGTLTLSGANTYTGTTTVSAGILQLGSTTALGTTAGATSVTSGAALDLNGQTYASSEALTINGTGVSSGGALLNSSATAATFPGLITLGSASSILGGTGTIAITNVGTILGPTFGLTLGGAQGGTMTSIIGTTTGTLTKQDAGTWTLSSTNTYTGATTISGGTLLLQAGYNSTSYSISSGAVLDLYTTNVNYDYNIATTFSGAGTLRKTGTGTIYWGAVATTFSLSSGALIDVQAGTFKGGSNANEVWTSNLSDLNIASGATFTSVEANVKVDALTGVGGLNSGYGGAGYANFTFGVDNGSGDFTGIIANGSSTGNFVKSGTGTQTFSGANTYTGTTTISAGTLKLGASEVIPDASAVTVTGTLDMNTFSETLGSIAGAGTIDNVVGAGTPTLTCGGDGTNTTFSGVIQNTTGTLALTKTGGGTLTLTGASTSTGVVTISAGTISIGNGSTTGSVASASILNNNDLIVNRSNAISYGGVISGTGTLTKSGAGTLTLSGTNTYLGSTSINAGVIQISNNAALGATSGNTSINASGSLWLDGGITSSENFHTTGSGSGTSNDLSNSAYGAIKNYAGTNTLSGTINLNQGGGGTLIEIADGTSLTISGGISTNQSTRSIYIRTLGTSTCTVSGVISNGSNVVTVEKYGTGTLTLSGTNTYTGTTTLSAGILKLNNTAALGSATGATTVTSGAALDLNGITYATAEALTISGTGVSSGGALINTGSSASFAGTVTMAADATFNTANQITLSGTISPSTYSLTKAGTSSLVFTSNTATVNSLAISAGTLSAGTSTINIYGNFTNSGTFTCGTGTVAFNGAAAQSIAAATFNSLTIANTTSPSTSAATMAGAITVNGTLTVTTGILNTSSDTITLGTSATISETATAYVTGSVKTTRPLVQNVANTFGGIGLSLTETTQASNSTIVKRVTGTASTGAGNTSIKRYFDITPAVDVALNGTMVFSYIDAELNGQTETDFKIYKSTNYGSTWTKETSSSVNTGANTVSLSSITSFSRWTVSNKTTNALPVELISFNANKSENGNLLHWKTAQETNSDYFDIERSHDGVDFEKISQLKGAGTKNSVTDYNYTDKSSNQTLATYYRLKQVDFDKKTEYSNIVFVNGSVGHKDFHLYPNPLEEGNKLYACLGDDDEGIIKVSVFDMSGKLLQDFLIDNIETGANITLENENLLLPKGMYIIEIKSIHNDYKQKLEVK